MDSEAALGEWRRRRLRGVALLALLVLPLLPCHAAAEAVDEYRLKAAFLYNFAAFTEWPASSPPGMTLCVLGTDPFGPVLDALNGKPVRGAAVKVQRLTQAGDAGRCHTVFISASERPGLAALLSSLKRFPVLTVADFDDAARQGVMIGLTLDQRRIVFDVNAEAARAAGLNVSSKLLKLARAVHKLP